VARDASGNFSAGTITAALSGNATTATSATTATTATNVSGGTASVTTLSASGVATFSAGSAAAPAITTSGDTNTGIFFPAADTIAFAEGGVESARIDASGNFGLGVTPSAWSTLRGFDILSGAGLAGAFNTAYLSGNAFFNGTNWIYKATSSAALQETGSGFVWKIATSGTAGNAISFTQAMTLDSGGRLLVGTTSQLINESSMSVSSSGNTATFKTTGGAGTNPLLVWNSGTSGTRDFISFGTGSSFTVVGSINTNGSTTAYNTSSDYRLKNTIAPMTGALAKVAALKPCTYKWNADGSDGEGFIAHELAEVVPDAVTGAKDAVDADGKPVYQGIDTSFLVATVVAALQELKAELDTVKAELAAMKGTA
jgi:hypothetical protein